MSIIDSFDFVGEDLRKRKFLLPERIVQVNGEVKDVEKLLDKKPLQIGLGEPSVTEFVNSGNGEKASVILDFGREIHGGIRLLVGINKGEEKYPQIKITFGESLSEVCSEVGADTSTNDHSPRQFTVPLPLLSDTTWGETGFRFVKIEVLTDNIIFKLKSALAVFIYRDYEYLGDFKCDDEEINKIYDVAAYTVHLCLQNMVWDGIKRDRLVWIGDMMIETQAVRDLFGHIDLVEESLEYVRDQTPLPGWMNNMASYSLWWVLILHDWYKATGNIEFLRRQTDYLNGLMRQLCDNVKPDGETTLPGYFLDWPTNGNPKSVAAVRSLMKMTFIAGIELCDILGLVEAAELSKVALDNLAKRTLDGGDIKQVVAVQSLADDTDSALAADIIEKDGIKGFSTFMGYHLTAALAKADRHGSALKLMKEYYSEMLKKGATTFFEDYASEWSDNSSAVATLPKDGEKDLHADFGAFCYLGLRHSFCHGWAGGPVPYLTEHVLGVSVLEPGCKSLSIKPHLDGLKWVKGKFPTPYGIVSIEHKLNSDGKVETTVDAPKEVKVIVG